MCAEAVGSKTPFAPMESPAAGGYSTPSTSRSSPLGSRSEGM